MAPTVVYVHGSGNQPPPEALKRIWDQALFGADAGNRSRMAYWADVRHPAPLPDRRTDEPEPAPEGEEGLAGEELPPAELIVEAVQQARAETLVGSPAGGRVPAGEVAPTGLDPWLREMAYVADAVVHGEESRPVQEVLPLPQPARDAVFRALVKQVFTDAYAYFFGGSGEAMRGRLRTTLAAVDGPVAVVTHSLGSVIAYDVLREPAPARELPLFVTMGSPLGITEVQDLITAPLRVPDGVAAWRNVADARDVVALDRTIRPEYAPPERTRDFLVVNDSENHHGAREYLRSAPVRSAVTALFA